MCAASPKLPGTWKASHPPGALLDQPRQQVEVAGDPLQGGVGDQDVDRPRPAASGAGRRPRSRAGRRRLPADGPRDHLRRGVDPATRARGQRSASDAGQLAGAAAEVDHAAGSLRGTPGQQVVERATALGGELQVLIRVP